MWGNDSKRWRVYLATQIAKQYAGAEVYLEKLGRYVYVSFQ